MTKKNIITVTRDTSLNRAAELLFANQLTGLPVVEDQQVVGIITEADLITKYDHLHIPSYVKFLGSFASKTQCPDSLRADYQKAIKIKVNDVMTKEVITINEQADVSQAVEILTQHHINPLPVVDQKNKLCGILSRSDIVRLFTGANFL